MDKNHMQPLIENMFDKVSAGTCETENAARRDAASFANTYFAASGGRRSSSRDVRAGRAMPRIVTQTTCRDPRQQRDLRKFEFGSRLPAEFKTNSHEFKCIANNFRRRRPAGPAARSVCHSATGSRQCHACLPSRCHLNTFA